VPRRVLEPRYRNMKSWNFRPEIFKQMNYVAVLLPVDSCYASPWCDTSCSTHIYLYAFLWFNSHTLRYVFPIITVDKFKVWYLKCSAKQAFYITTSDVEIRQILIPKFWHRQFFEQYPSSTMNRLGKSSLCEFVVGPMISLSRVFKFHISVFGLKNK